MASTGLALDAMVISLARTPERLVNFRERFACSALPIECLPGVDGSLVDRHHLVQQGMLAESALSWPQGQIGCALSHLRCLFAARRRNLPLLILEDDAVPFADWESELGALLNKAPVEWELLLLGWNLDSCLQLEWAPGQTFTSLFQPRYPSAEVMAEALGAVNERQWLRLQKGLGLAGYLISPLGAAKILSWALPLRTLPIEASGLPPRSCFSFDGQLNSFYPQLQAWAAFPPLLLGINDKPSSETAV